MYCGKCGKEIENDSRFCPYCGYGNGADISSTGSAGIAAEADGHKALGSGKWIIPAAVISGVVIIGAAAFLGFKLMQKPEEVTKSQIPQKQEQKAESVGSSDKIEKAEKDEKAYPQEITLDADVKEEVTDLLDLLCRMDGLNKGGQLSENPAIDDSFVSSFLTFSLSEGVPFVNGQAVEDKNDEWVVSKEALDQYLKDSVGCEDYNLDHKWATYSGSNVILQVVTPTGGYGIDTSKISRIEQISGNEIEISGSNEFTPDTIGTPYSAEFDVIMEENPDSIWGGYTLKEIKDWKHLDGGNQNQAQNANASVGVSNGDYILPEINSRYYTENELSGMDAQSLYLARNELYARHGYIFKKQELKDYFGNKPWYTPQVTEVPDSAFNQYEKANLELIQNLEAR